MPNKKPLLILARHGRTSLNKGGESGEEKIRGWADIKLDSQGRKDAKELAKKLSTYDIEVVYASPLSRALDTGRAVAEAVGVVEEPKRELKPWNLGALTGQPVKSVIHIMKDHVDHENKVITGGESFHAFKSRCLAFIKAATEEAARDNKIVCCVAHTRNLQLTKAWLAAGAPDDFRIDDKTMDDYSDETSPGGMIEIMPHEILGPEWKHGSLDNDGVGNDETDSEDEDGT